MAEPRKLPDLLPKSSELEPPDMPSRQHDDDDGNRRGKRISSACVPCKRRKTRCDGNQPCSSCIDRATECSFDPTSDKRRKSHLAKDIEFLAERKETLAKILETARNCDDNVYQRALQMIRTGDPLNQVAQFLEDLHLPAGGAGQPTNVSTSPFGSSQDVSEPTSYAGSAASALENYSLSVTNSTSGLGSIASLPSQKQNIGGLSSQSEYSPQSSILTESSSLIGGRGSLTLGPVQLESNIPMEAISSESHPKLYQERLGELSRRQAGPLSAFPIWHYTSGPDSVNVTATASSTSGDGSDVDPEEDPTTWDKDQTSIAHSVKYWTSVSGSVPTVSYLFSLYKTVWGVSVYYFIDFDLFLQDMIPCVMSGELGGSSKFYFACDLANAILAVSCFFCTKPCAFADVCEPISRGEHFIQEATTQVKIVTQLPCLPSAQSYACLALAEGCRGRLGSARRLWLLCFDMLLSLIKEPRRPSREPQQSSTSNPQSQQQAQLFDQDQQRISLQEEIYEDQPRRQSETQQMNMEWEPNLSLLKFQIRRTTLALGLFCIESIYLSEHNAPDRAMRSTPYSNVDEQMLRDRHQSNLEAASHATTTTTTSLSLPTELPRDDRKMVELVAALKVEMTNHQPPGFLTPEYQDSEQLLGLDAVEKLSQAFPKLGVIYKQLKSLWADIPSD